VILLPMSGATELFSPEVQQSFEKFFPFLMEIRKRLLFLVALMFVSAAFGFLYYERIIRLILRLYNLEGVNIVFTSPFQFMGLAVSSALTVSIITVLPIFIIQFLSFIKPALKPREFRMVVSLIPVSLVLFIFGFGIGSLMMKYIVEIFYQKSLELEIGNLLDISKLLSQIIVTSALMGLAFQFPIALTLLLRLKIVKYKAMASQRMLAWAASIFFAALLPPTDILSLVALTAPLIILFETTLFLNRFVFRPVKR